MQTVNLSLFGIDVAVTAGEQDLEELGFFFAGQPAAATPCVEVELHAEGGFFASLLNKDARPKYMKLIEAGRTQERRFHNWSELPAFLPPFASQAFQDRFTVCPGEVILTPHGEATLLTGHHHVGKTAVTLELFQRGWGFVSEHLAVIDDTTGQAQPRTGLLGLRRQTLIHYQAALAGLPIRESVSEVTGRVVFVHLADLMPGVPLQDRPIALSRHVHLLGDDPGASPQVADPGAIVEFCYPPAKRETLARWIDLPRHVIPMSKAFTPPDAAERICRMTECPVGRSN